MSRPGPLGLVVLVARREALLLLRGRAGQASLVVLLALAWLPPLALPLRDGLLGLAPLDQVLPLALSLAGVVIPVLALLQGADVLAGELEDGTLVPVLMAPVPRGVCLLGKLVGRLAFLGASYLVAFGSVAGVYLHRRGAEGVPDYLAVAAAGLLLGAACGGLGALLGVRARGRVRAFGRALATWVLLVFVLDALLLGVVVALSPPPPTTVGCHGHSELEQLSRERDVAPGGKHEEVPWVLALNPVDLYRLTAIATSPTLRRRMDRFLPVPFGRAWLGPLLVGWAVWLLLPLGLARRSFGRLRIRA